MNKGITEQNNVAVAQTSKAKQSKVSVKVVAAVVLSVAGTALIGAIVKGIALVAYGH